MKTLPQIEAEVHRRATLIGAAEHRSLPTFGHTEDLARPHIEVDPAGYHYVVVERGRELARFTTRDLDDLLYQIFQGVTFSLAGDHELARRIEAQDPRRLHFQQQVELLSQLSPRWGQREAEEHRRILQKHPFDNYASMRARLSSQVGWKMACEQYPLPAPLGEN